MEHNLQSSSSEIKRALKQSVQVEDGRRGYVFTEIGYQGSEPRWLCHICCRTIISERNMSLHIAHPLHNRKLLLSSHPAAQFKKFLPNNEISGPSTNNEDYSSGDEKFGKSPLKLEHVTDVVPGEPVPPGMEDIVEGVCQIQTTIDAYKENPLIGLEYIVELISTEVDCEPRYICLLCEKKGDPRSVMVHVTSQNHYLKYISCFFRTAGNALNMIPRTNDTRKGIAIAITKVAAEIERNYGRLKPTSAEAETFMSKKYEILRKIDEKEHFRETAVTTFAELVTMDKIREYNGISDDAVKTVNTTPPTRKEDLYNKEKAVVNHYIPKNINSPKKFSFTFGKPEPSNKTEKDVNIPMRKLEEPPVMIKTEPPATPIMTMRTTTTTTVDSDDDDVIFVPDDKNSTAGAKVRSLSSVSPVSSQTSRSCSRSNSRPRSRGGRSRTRSRSRSWSSRRRSYRARLRSRSHSRSRYASYRKSRDPYRERERHSPHYSRSSRHSPLPFHHTYSSRSHRRSYSRSRSRSRSRDRRFNDRDHSRYYKPYPAYRPDNKSYDDRYHHHPHPVESHPGGERWRHLPRREERSSSRQREETEYRYKEIRKKEEEERIKKIKWNEFEQELKIVETEMNERLKYYQSRPEKHPMYPEEWKSFWNRRYKELQQSGQDPSQYDFKPEWIDFWDKRMKEIHEQELAAKKEELRSKLNVEDLGRKRTLSSDLQDISPPTPETHKDVTVDDIKNTWKALTGSDITAPSAKRSLSPWEDSSSSPPPYQDPFHAQFSPKVTATNKSWTLQRPMGRKFYESVTPIVHCLRMLSVLENQLGSLGPKVLELLSKALALEKTKSSASMTLIQNRDIYILFDTIKEKLRGQLLAGIVMRHLVAPTRAVIKSIDNMLISNPLNPEVFEPVKVVGVGMVDKVVVAQQIASALVAQGKTDVSQQELEELINAVVGMAKASNAKTTTGMSSAAFFSQLDIQNSTGSSHINQILNNMISAAQKSLNKQTEPVPPIPTSSTSTVQLSPSGLKVDSPADNKKLNKISDSALKEGLMKFKDLPREEQHRLIALLKELERSQPDRVEKLREFVTVSLTTDTRQTGGRLSPFSLRSGSGANPSPERTSEPISNRKMGDSEDDDDYTIEDVYKAASESLRMNEQQEHTEQTPQQSYESSFQQPNPLNNLLYPPIREATIHTQEDEHFTKNEDNFSNYQPPPEGVNNAHNFPLMPPPMLNNFIANFGDSLRKPPEYPAYQTEFKPF